MNPTDEAPRRRGRPRGTTTQGVETRRRLHATAIELMAARGYQGTTLRDVAKEAGVSKAYLYTQPLFRDRIEALRHQQQEQQIREKVTRPTGKTDAGKDLVILAKERRIKELEEENRKLKQQLKVALGKAYDQL